MPGFRSQPIDVGHPTHSSRVPSRFSQQTPMAEEKEQERRVSVLLDPLWASRAGGE
jgi:hypothetical protein